MCLQSLTEFNAGSRLTSKDPVTVADFRRFVKATDYVTLVTTVRNPSILGSWDQSGPLGGRLVLAGTQSE